MKFTKAYLKKEAKEPAHSKMNKSQKAHEAKESPAHEKAEHKAVAKMLKKSLKK